MDSLGKKTSSGAISDRTIDAMAALILRALYCLCKCIKIVNIVKCCLQ